MSVTVQPVSPDLIRAHRAAIREASRQHVDAWKAFEDARNTYADSVDNLIGQLNQLTRYLDTLIGDRPTEAGSDVLVTEEMDVGEAMNAILGAALFGTPAPFPAKPIRNADYGDRERGC